jgi:hypothetical protein
VPGSPNAPTAPAPAPTTSTRRDHPPAAREPPRRRDRVVRPPPARLAEARDALRSADYLLDTGDPAHLPPDTAADLADHTSAALAAYQELTSLSGPAVGNVTHLRNLLQRPVDDGTYRGAAG